MEGIFGGNPETSIRAGYSVFDRSNYFAAHTYDFSYGYRWKETQTKMHELDLISIDYFNITDVDESVENDYILNRNLNEQLIFSLKYAYTINTLLYSKRSINTYFNAAAEFAGHTLSLLNTIFKGGTKPDDSASKILGVEYSQFARFNTDFRMYFKLSERNKLVGRNYTGIGLPYGNSRFLPYQKQFFTGGISSIRAFPSRALGPGSYISPDSLETSQNLERSGDIKLETNLEFRFDIFKIVKGALFVDAGNVWLLKEDKQIPGGAFHFSSALNELAFGTGFGIRLDASFLVIRLDVAFPIRKPYFPDNERWVLNSIDFASRDWRQENLVFNLAIGYPF